jgi:hypothetical protein
MYVYIHIHIIKAQWHYKYRLAKLDSYGKSDTSNFQLIKLRLARGFLILSLGIWHSVPWNCHFTIGEKFFGLIIRHIESYSADKLGFQQIYVVVAWGMLQNRLLISVFHYFYNDKIVSVNDNYFLHIMCCYFIECLQLCRGKNMSYCYSQHCVFTVPSCTDYS